MPIRFQCACGNRHLVPDSLVGTDVRCSKCGAVLHPTSQSPSTDETRTAPRAAPQGASTADTPKVQPPESTIRVRCSCGKVYGTSVASAGKSFTCKSCGSRLVIPSRATEDGGSTAETGRRRKMTIMGAAAAAVVVLLILFVLGRDFGIAHREDNSVNSVRNGTAKSADTGTHPPPPPSGVPAPGGASIYRAAEDGDMARVRQLLDSGTDINSASSQKRTALHQAAQEGHRDIVELLLSKGAKVDAQDGNRLTPLHVAAYIGQKDIVGLLLAKGATIDARDRTEVTPLHFAVMQGRKDVVELLLSKGADIEAKDINGYTALHMTGMCGQSEIAALLIAKGANLQAKSENGSTPLDKVESELSVKNPLDKKGKEEVAALLRKASSTTASASGSTTSPAQKASGSPTGRMLERADILGGRDAVAALISKGADVNAKDDKGQTPLHWAAQDGDTVAVADLLIAKGANVNAKDNRGKTPLHAGVMKVNNRQYVTQTGVIELLLSRGADVNARDNDGDTPLHTAAGFGTPDFVKLLMSKGANVNAKDNDGNTPLQRIDHKLKYSSGDRRDYEEVARLLRDAGAR